MEKGGEGMDYRSFYNMEDYLFYTVRSKFLNQGYLSAFDFFCIIIWKANRAKSKIAQRLMKKGYKNLEEAVRALTEELTQQKNAKERLRCLIQSWGFLLPMASAILTVLYPEEFTVYDVRVCDSLGDCHKLSNVTDFEKLWHGYVEFKSKVSQAVPDELSLRDKDRYLWGKSFHEQLSIDIEKAFAKD